MIIRLYLIAILFSLLISCKAQNNNRIEDWKSYQLPTNPDTLYKISANINYRVLIKDNKVVAEKYSSSERHKPLPFPVKKDEREPINTRGVASYLKVDNGYLVGFNRGEWGGDLYWTADDGSQHYKISTNQIIQFIKKDSDIYAIDGLAHLSLSFGSIIQLQKINNKWIASKYVTLPTAPAIVAIDKKNNFIVATSKSLLQIDSKLIIHSLIDKAIWFYGDPNSIVIQDNTAYIGMEGCVVKYNFTTGQQQMLKPN